MSVIPEGLYYSKEHEWVRVEGKDAYVGVTDHAQASLGDIVFAQGEPAGTAVKAGETVGTLESVKAASDVYAPVTGTVTQVNEALADAPEKVNSAPYESWLVKLSLADESELGGLMDAAAYKDFCGEEA